MFSGTYFVDSVHSVEVPYQPSVTAACHTATERRGYSDCSRLALLAEPELYAKDGRGVPRITGACGDLLLQRIPLPLQEEVRCSGGRVACNTKSIAGRNVRQDTAAKNFPTELTKCSECFQKPIL